MYLSASIERLTTFVCKAKRLFIGPCVASSACNCQVSQSERLPSSYLWHLPRPFCWRCQNCLLNCSFSQEPLGGGRICNRSFGEVQISNICQVTPNSLLIEPLQEQNLDVTWFPLQRASQSVPHPTRRSRGSVGETETRAKLLCVL